VILDRFTTRCRVPEVLEEVTTIRSEREVKPRSVGVDARAVGSVWRAVERLYRSGIHPAIQLCVRCRGGILIDRAIGHARGNGPSDLPGTPKELATPQTPFNIFSASKAITAMVIHWLDQRNLLRIDDPVCEYLPEFARHGKEGITIRHVLTHRAGIPNVPADAMDLALLEKPHEIVRLLCDAKPTSIPGRQLAYHAISGGFVLGEVARRVAGKDIRALLDQHILRPLGFRWMRYGVEARDVSRVALSYVTGPPQLPIVPIALRRALGVAHEDAVRLSNDPRFLVGVVPAGNVVTTADELSRFYQVLLNGGELDGVRVFEPRTVRRATVEQSYLEFDLTLGLPVRYGMGFMLGGRWLSFYGPDTEHAFGHLGFTNIVSWADPERQIAAALITSGKPLVYPQLYYAYDILRQIGAAVKRRKR
jgi:CubicO group peptidase (beta-lactamase class C family)